MLPLWQMTWLLTLVTGSGAGSKRVSRNKVLLHRRLLTSVNMTFQNFGSSGQINDLPSYPSEHVSMSSIYNEVFNSTTDAPVHLKKELDTVLSLQAKLDGSERTLQGAQSIIEKARVSQETHDALASLERGHKRLISKLDVLYASLNIHDRFPELDGVNVGFVQILLLTHDLKINICKRVIGSFFEWDKLDHTVGGKEKALGKSFWSYMN